MSSSSAASNGHKPLGALVKDDGTTVIASSRRPDGTWRKERRVRDGYVPQDEVVSYRPGDSRSQQQRQHPVGWDPSMATQQTKPSVKKKDGEKKANKKKTAGGVGGGGVGGGGGGGGSGETARTNGGVDGVAASLGHVSLDDKGSGGGDMDPAKRLKALQKKLRQVDELAEKERGGAELTAEQREKLGRRQALLEEMAQVEQLIRSAEGTPPPPTSTPTPTHIHPPSHTHTNTSASSSSADEESAKLLKALRKKLKQIEELAGRDACTLSEEERGKVARKDEVVNEIRVLEMRAEL